MMVLLFSIDDKNIISLFMSLSLKLIMILLFSDQRWW
jgi:hypothetical protein